MPKMYSIPWFLNRTFQLLLVTGVATIVGADVSERIIGHFAVPVTIGI